MTKKYREPVAEAPAKAGMQTPLLDFLRWRAPDILLPMPVMQEASALRFWQEIFQPPRPGEGKRLVNEALSWPYAERLIYLAREFARLDEGYQRYVVKAGRAQIWWRGDDMPRFRQIVEAHVQYRSLNDAEKNAYRKSLIGAARRFGKV